MQSSEQPPPTAAVVDVQSRSRILAGTEYQDYSWKAPASFHAPQPHQHLYHREVMNFGRQDNNNYSLIRPVPCQCIMCGRSDVTIPTQNKNICKFCDSSFWLHVAHQAVFKFCKGCKNFFFLEEFTDKPRGTKCEKCRERGKELYHMKKAIACPPTQDASSLGIVHPGLIPTAVVNALRRRSGRSPPANPVTPGEPAPEADQEHEHEYAHEYAHEDGDVEDPYLLPLPSTPGAGIGTGPCPSATYRSAQRPPRGHGKGTPLHALPLPLPSVTPLSMLALLPGSLGGSLHDVPTVTPFAYPSPSGFVHVKAERVAASASFVGASPDLSLVARRSRKRGRGGYEEHVGTPSAVVTPQDDSAMGPAALLATPASAGAEKWSWDPDGDPLMQLAMITSASHGSPLR